MGALWSSCTSTVSPFFRTNLVYLMSGMGICGDAATEWAAVFRAGLAAGLGAALWLKELMPIRVTARNRPAILCMNLLLKVPPCWSSEDILDRRRQSCRRDLISNPTEKVCSEATDTSLSKHTRKSEGRSKDFIRVRGICE